MENKVLKIQRLKKENDAVVLAHYYVPDEVQEIADYIGDSYYLSQLATQVKEQTVVLCGVSFMGESAKLLNPQKTVLMPDADADCPMAHMCSVEKIEEIRRQYPDVAVVCYVNSTAELKAQADVCVTSSNAVKIVKNLPNKNIYFIPDGNLGRFVASQVPDKHIILNDGYCPIHKQISEEVLREKIKEHPQAKVLVHPECTEEVTKLADYAGSTSGIIQYAKESECSEFIIGTETGVLHKLLQNDPDKKYYPVMEPQICWDMKKITLDKIIEVLETGKNKVCLSEELMNAANKPLEKMLELAK